ncbi:MAG: polymer-forming cytoskeletal protein [Planctomycetes bacterium]|nr:polymer-forming cytoskeletal protein [Planctomycetota bacterium]
MGHPNEEFSTTIGPDAVFKGELRFEKGVKLLGRLEGEIASEGNLLIGEGAKLIGNAKVGAIRLDGEVKGNLEAASKVQLSASARLEGDLQTARLEVAEGAVLVGRCTIGVNGKAPVTGGSKPSTSVPHQTPPVSAKTKVEQVQSK